LIQFFFICISFQENAKFIIFVSLFLRFKFYLSRCDHFRSPFPFSVRLSLFLKPCFLHFIHHGRPSVIHRPPVLRNLGRFFSPCFSSFLSILSTFLSSFHPSWPSFVITPPASSSQSRTLFLSLSDIFGSFSDISLILCTCFDYLLFPLHGADMKYKYPVPAPG